MHGWIPHPPGADTPQGVDTPQSKHHLVQTPPPSRHSSPQEQTPPGADTPPPRYYRCCGRYASYWNAFLFDKIFTKNRLGSANASKKFYRTYSDGVALDEVSSRHFRRVNEPSSVYVKITLKIRLEILQYKTLHLNPAIQNTAKLHCRFKQTAASSGLIFSVDRFFLTKYNFESKKFHFI